MQPQCRHPCSPERLVSAPGPATAGMGGRRLARHLAPACTATPAAAICTRPETLCTAPAASPPLQAACELVQLSALARIVMGLPQEPLGCELAVYAAAAGHRRAGCRTTMQVCMSEPQPGLTASHRFPHDIQGWRLWDWRERHSRHACPLSRPAPADRAVRTVGLEWPHSGGSARASSGCRRWAVSRLQASSRVTRMVLGGLPELSACQQGSPQPDPGAHQISAVTATPLNARPWRRPQQARPVALCSSCTLIISR